jgi:tetratricopeptide (TPR) repeat protein
MRATRFFVGLMMAASILRGAGTPAVPKPVWQTDWNAAFAKARQERRLVFVAYTAGGCDECQNVERLTFGSPEMMQHLADFVLLRVDTKYTKVPSAHQVSDLPAYLVYDPSQRERFRIAGHDAGAHLTVINLDRIHLAAPAFLQAADLLDAKQDLEAAFLMANTYGRLKMESRARDAYAEARKLAEQRGDAAAARIAEVQSASTFASQGDAPKAVRLLKELTQRPAPGDSGAITWLALGQGYEKAKDTKSALDAYTRAQSMAASGSRTATEAGESAARLLGAAAGGAR